MKTNCLDVMTSLMFDTRASGVQGWHIYLRDKAETCVRDAAKAKEPTLQDN